MVLKAKQVKQKQIYLIWELIPILTLISRGLADSMTPTKHCPVNVLLVVLVVFSNCSITVSESFTYVELSEVIKSWMACFS